MTKKRLRAKFDLGLNETGIGGVLGGVGGLAIFEGFAHMGGAGMVLAGAVAIIGGLNGKLVADGSKFVAEQVLTNPPTALAQETFGRNASVPIGQGASVIRQSSDVAGENTINLGINKRTRQDAAYTMYQLKGILVLGLPGMGKTVTVSTIASQLVDNGAHLSIIDIKGQLDDSLTGLLSPFEAAFVTPPAHTPQLMIEAAEYADSILDDRLSKRSTNLYPYYLIIDEFTDLMLSLKTKDRYTEAANKIAEVVKRINILGRSLNIFCFCIGQITTADTTGGTAIRETFNTRILHGMSEYEAGIVDKNGGKKTISQLNEGEAYVSVGGIKGEPQVVKIKMLTNDEKRRIASGIVPLRSFKETRELPEIENELDIYQKKTEAPAQLLVPPILSEKGQRAEDIDIDILVALWNSGHNSVKKLEKILKTTNHQAQAARKRIMDLGGQAKEED